MSPVPPAAARAALVGICCASLASGQAGAREWNSAVSLDLARRATDRRAAQLADTGLVDYRAIAHGYVTFFGQLGDGFPDPPQVIRADELAVEVYWRAPNRSKQRVVGRRAELLKPTDIAYHADHLAIVQNNFPAIIRLGDGDEVRDVPHPLSTAGVDAYDFAVADSLTIRVAGRTWDVVAVDFRPRDPNLARAVGTAYIDRESGSVVRLGITFTRAALIDPALEDVSIVLDNGLVDGRFWLPRRQEIEIRRTGRWLDFPARGIIRGEWDLCCVEANLGLPAETFAGPEIAFASPSALSAYPFPGRLSDSIAVRVEQAGAGRDVARVQRHALELVRAAALRPAARPRLAGRAISDFARVNRVEGLALGGGATVPAGYGAAATGVARYGIDDRLIKYRATLSVPVPAPGRRLAVAVSTFDEFRAAGDTPEASGVGNSIASQEFGADVSDDFRVAGVALSLAGGESVRWRITGERVRESPLTVRATPFSGTYRDAFGADARTASRLRLELGARAQPAPLGLRLNWQLTVTGDDAEDRSAAMSRAQRYGRFSGDIEAARVFSAGTLHARAIGAVATAGGVPEQGLAMFGGPVTGPGYGVHSIRGRAGISVRAEWQWRVATVVMPLGRFGRVRTDVTLAPFGTVASVSDEEFGAHRVSRRSAGIAVVSLFDALRIDVARGVDPGGRWMVRADFGRAWWPIL